MLTIHQPIKKKIITILFLSLLIAGFLTIITNFFVKDRYTKNLSYKVINFSEHEILALINKRFNISGNAIFTSFINNLNTLTTSKSFDNACVNIKNPKIGPGLPVLVSILTHGQFNVEIIAFSKNEIKDCENYIYSIIEDFNLQRQKYYFSLMDRLGMLYSEIPSKKNDLNEERPKLIDKTGLTKKEVNTILFEYLKSTFSQKKQFVIMNTEELKKVKFLILYNEVSGAKPKPGNLMVFISAFAIIFLIMIIIKSNLLNRKKIFFKIDKLLR